MRHVDEGELHAWLDGALDQLGDDRAVRVREHLRACASCREALVAEETLRARADEVLALAAPRTIDAPPFETLMERAHGTPAGTPVRASRLSRAARLGWAASVVIAVGAGWMARTVELSPAGSGEIAASGVVTPPRAPMGSSAGMESSAGVESSPGVGSSARMESSAPSPGDRAPAPDANVAGVVPSAGRGERPSAGAASAERVAEKAASDVVGAALEAAPVASAPAAVASVPSAPLAAPSASVTATLQAPAGQPRVPAAASGLGSMAQPTATARTIAIVSRRPRVGEAAAMAVRSSGVGLLSGPDTTSVPGLFARGRSGGGATKMEVSNIADVDEAVDLIVPELPVLKVEWTQVSPGRPGLRVLQRLSPTDTLEVRFVRSGGAAADALDNPLVAVVESPLPAGLSQVVRVHRDGWLVARAPLAPAELEALMDRVGSPRSR